MWIDLRSMTRSVTESGKIRSEIQELNKRKLIDSFEIDIVLKDIFLSEESNEMNREILNT